MREEILSSSAFDWWIVQAGNEARSRLVLPEFVRESPVSTFNQ
jgi:hypothetical protein